MTREFPPVPLRCGLYAIVDSVEWIARLLDAGVMTLQLRMKQGSAAEKEQAIIDSIHLAASHQARLFINDDWQLAIKHGAYGVHLGQEDLETADLGAILEAGLRLGVSTHDSSEIARVLPLNPSYIALGHVFPTNTKQMPSLPQGLDNLRHHVRQLAGIPTVAIGGISIDRAAEVLATGVGSIAVVSAITAATDWREAVAQLQSRVAEADRGIADAQ